ncbi:MAG: DNA-deoxyinosine glycosylase [Pseudomonadota bacterium]
MAVSALIQSFEPIADERSRVLILGTMPGEASLAKNQYYAHARNQFWPIMAQLFDFSPMLRYDERCEELLKHRVGVWDVLRCCLREGSLDSAIDTRSIVANDFRAFFEHSSEITQIFFNGGNAQRLYTRHVLPGLPPPLSDLSRHRLPSTSPAYAAMAPDEKLRRWRQLIDIESGRLFLN